MVSSQPVGHWVSSLSSEHLLSAIEHEWRPWLRLLRTVSTQSTWSATRRVLGEELAAVTGAHQIGLAIALHPTGIVRSSSLIGPPVPLRDYAADMGQVARDGDLVSLQVLQDPSVWLVLDKTAPEEMCKMLAVVGPELGEVLKSYRGELLMIAEGPDQFRSTDVRPAEQLSLNELLGSLAAIDQGIAAAEHERHVAAETARDAFERHDKSVLDAAWERYDACLAEYERGCNRREAVRQELVRQAVQLRDRWRTKAAEQVEAWRQQSQARQERIMNGLRRFQDGLADLEGILRRQSGEREALLSKRVVLAPAEFERAPLPRLDAAASLPEFDQMVGRLEALALRCLTLARNGQA